MKPEASGGIMTFRRRSPSNISNKIGGLMNHRNISWRRLCIIRAAIESLERRAILSTYGATDLGTLNPGESEEVDAIDINNAGHIVGNVSLPYDAELQDYPSRAFIYSNGRMTALPGVFAHGSSEAHDINNLDEIVG